MKESEKIEHLLKVFYDRYQKEEIVRQYGLYPWDLTGNSGTDFGDAGAQLAAVDRMRARGWIRILNFPRAKRVLSGHRIQLTEEGISHAEELLKPAYQRHLRDFWVSTVEGITRGLKK